MGHQGFTMRRFTSTKTTAMGNRRGVQNPRGATLQPQPCPLSSDTAPPLLSGLPGSIPAPALTLSPVSFQCGGHRLLARVRNSVYKSLAPLGGCQGALQAHFVLCIYEDKKSLLFPLHYFFYPIMSSYLLQVNTFCLVDCPFLSLSK